MCLEHTALEKLEKGRIEDAHHIVQELDSRTACWIHAVIHKVEGDLGNSTYWYQRAGLKNPDLSLSEEIERIKEELNQQVK